ncbi:MAG: hypothetical protein Q9227_009013 [Pyrenula ochraceoflavens]
METLPNPKLQRPLGSTATSSTKLATLPSSHPPSQSTLLHPVPSPPLSAFPMIILPLLGYLGLLLGFSFLTLSIASGLYYLSELVEEHTVLASRTLRRLIYTIILLLCLLWLFDSFPFTLILLGIFSHLVYASNLRHFPIVKLSDPLFLLSCALVVVNHWLWFRFFSSPGARFGAGGRQTKYGGSGGGGPYGGGGDRYGTMVTQPSFTEIASYFGLCVWLVPFALFVSLSAGENVLPSMGSEYATGEREGVGSPRGSGGGGSGKPKTVGLAKAAVDGVREWVGETGAVMGWWRGENVRRF